MLNENPRPIRMAYVIDKLARHGSQKVLIHLVQCLSQRNYQQRIYSLNDVVHPDNKNALLKYGAEVRIIGKRQLLLMIGLVRIVYDWLIWKPEIVFTMLFYSDVIGRIAAKITSVPIIISSIRARNSERNRFQEYLARLTTQWADKVVFNTKEIIPFALQHEGIREDQIVYIPNGVNILFDHIDQVKKREELGVSKETLLIGAVGRLHPEKGFSYLLQAFQLVQEQFDDCVLLFIGTGASLEILTSLANELNISGKVRFLGERTDVHELLACLNVYVQSSLFEGMSNALMEAMAMGKPVVATSVGGTLELIENEKTGWLVTPEDPEMLAEKICYVLKHPTLAEEVGVAAAERMAQDFSLEKMANSYDQLFRGLISNNVRRTI